MPEEIVKGFGYSHHFATLLKNRCANVEDIEDFLNPKLKNLLPNPHIFNDMRRAIVRVSKAITNKENIGIFGDYDVDGASATALLIRFFEALNHHNYFVHIPDRLKEGYGPNIPAIAALKKKDISVLIMVDCGTSAIDQIEFANANNIDVIVLDHHLPSEKLPNAYALINPNAQNDMRADLKGLCAGGVCFLFLIALKTYLNENGTDISKIDLLDLLDIVALSTVCDVMPLIGLNRGFVKQGLVKAKDKPTLGIDVLAKTASLKSIETAYHFGFMLGPRINAGGRVGDSNLGYKLLSTNDFHEATGFSQRLHALNEERKSIEADMLDLAHKRAKELGSTKTLLIGDQTFHAGIIGIIAGKLAQTYRKPAMIMAYENDIAMGSARSGSNFDIGAMLSKAASQNILLSGGGHKAAGGFKLRIDMIEHFYDFVEDYIADFEIKPKEQKPELILPLTALTKNLHKEIRLLEPFGEGNPEPLIMLENVIVESFYVMKEKHLKCIIKDTMGNRVEGVYFFQTDIDTNKFSNILGYLDFFRDKVSLRIHSIV